MVITDHAVEEAGSELRDGQEVEAESIVSNFLALNVIVSNFLAFNDNLVGGNGADSLSESISGIDTSIEVLLLVPVKLLISDINLDDVAVQEPVLGNSLGQQCWLGEDLSPGLNGCDVIIHALACGHG